MRLIRIVTTSILAFQSIVTFQAANAQSLIEQNLNGCDAVSDSVYSGGTGSVFFRKDSRSVSFAITDKCERRQARGWLYKPESQDTGDAREGKPAMLFTRSKPTKTSIKVYAKNGVQVCSFKYYKGSEENGRRYYAGTGCGKSAAQIAAAAKAVSGSSRIYFEANGKDCAGPVDNPKSRVDLRN